MSNQQQLRVQLETAQKEEENILKELLAINQNINKLTQKFPSKSNNLQQKIKRVQFNLIVRCMQCKVLAIIFLGGFSYM